MFSSSAKMQAGGAQSSQLSASVSLVPSQASASCSRPDRIRRPDSDVGGGRAPRARFHPLRAHEPRYSRADDPHRRQTPLCLRFCSSVFQQRLIAPSLASFTQRVTVRTGSPPESIMAAINDSALFQTQNLFLSPAPRKSPRILK